MPITVLTHGRVTWINIVHPAPEDIQHLSAQCPQFHPLNLQDCLTEREVPKLDHHDDYLFLVVHLPYWDAGEQISRPAEVDIFVARGIFVTSHRGELKPLVEMFASAQADESRRAEWMGRGASPLLHHLLNVLVDYCFPIVRRVGHNLRHIEEKMFHNDTRHMLHEVAVVRRDIIALRSILKPQLEADRRHCADPAADHPGDGLWHERGHAVFRTSMVVLYCRRSWLCVHRLAGMVSA